MKKLVALLLIIPVLFLVSFTPVLDELTKEERSQAIQLLKGTEENLLKNVQHLSDVQLHFKPNAESWSIAECVEHLTISESAIFGVLEASLEAGANPARRAEVQMSDEQVLLLVSGRDKKVKTIPEMEPKGTFGSYENSITEFKKLRHEHIKFVEKSTDDFRNHYAEFPFGVLDTYQVVIFLAAHTKRHTLQIEEIMADPNFPQKK